MNSSRRIAAIVIAFGTLASVLAVLSLEIDRAVLEAIEKDSISYILKREHKEVMVLAVENKACTVLSENYDGLMKTNVQYREGYLSYIQSLFVDSKTKVEVYVTKQNAAHLKLRFKTSVLEEGEFSSRKRCYNVRWRKPTGSTMVEVVISLCQTNEEIARLSYNSEGRREKLYADGYTEEYYLAEGEYEGAFVRVKIRFNSNGGYLEYSHYGDVSPVFPRMRTNAKNKILAIGSDKLEMLMDFWRAKPSLLLLNKMTDSSEFEFLSTSEGVCSDLREYNSAKMILLKSNTSSHKLLFNKYDERNRIVEVQKFDPRFKGTSSEKHSFIYDCN